jgi:orotate phosphoribosyltransferase
VSAAAIIDRGTGQQRLDVPFSALARVDLPTYEADVCPLCAAGQPVVKPGSRTA